MLGHLTNGRAANAGATAWALLFCFYLHDPSAGADAWRVANTTLRLPLEPPLVNYQAVNIFGGLTFRNRE